MKFLLRSWNQTLQGLSPVLMSIFCFFAIPCPQGYSLHIGRGISYSCFSNFKNSRTRECTMQFSALCLWHIIYTNVTSKSCEFKKEAYRDGKRKGDEKDGIHEAWLMNINEQIWARWHPDPITQFLLLLPGVALVSSISTLGYIACLFSIF